MIISHPNIEIKKLTINNIKMENNKLKKINVENFKYYYFVDIVKNKSFSFNISKDEKSYENVLVYDISY